LDGANPVYGEAVASSLCDVVNLLARGDAPAYVAKHLAGGKLVGLPKGEGDLRPIAVGESLRRLTAKCLCARAQAKVAQSLFPEQFGVGLPGGGEALVHAVRQWRERSKEESDAVALELDLRNAFNLVERDVLIAQCRAELPELAAFVEWCYGEETVLLFGGQPVLSRCGVQQGDPLGPLLFCLALRAMLAEARARGQMPERNADCRGFFYLDDGVFCGRAAQVRAALGAIQELGPSFGLHLHLEKCVLLNAGTAEVPSGLFPRELSVVTELSLLKSPIGSDLYCEEAALAKVNSLQAGLDRVASMADAHTAFRILAVCCGSSKVTWLARTTPPGSIRGALHEFDARVRSAFGAVMRTALSPAQWEQASLGPASGGMGLRGIASHAAAAYLSSRALTHHLCVQSDPAATWSGDVSVKDAVRQVEALLPPGADLLRGAENEPPKIKQHTLSDSIDKRRLDVLLGSVPVRDQARLRSCAVPHAAAWVTAPPAAGIDLHLGTPQFRAAARLWLGASMGMAGMCSCGAQADEQGVHALACKHGAGPVRRHNRLRNVIFQASRAAGLLPELEKTGILPGGHERPADVFLNRWPGGGPEHVALDIAVVSPLQGHYVNAAAKSALVAATAYADKKANREETEARCLERGVRFEPLVVESYGAWSDGARRTITTIAGLATPCDEVTTPQQSVHRLFQRLSVTLMRANAQTLLDRQQALSSHTKHPFRGAALRHVEELKAEVLAAATAPQDAESPTPIDARSPPAHPSPSLPASPQRVAHEFLSPSGPPELVSPSPPPSI
jgi:hypothetical protein